ncbi:M20/M25/M40 family metallo-hydrolase [Heliorestis acidaminivorans]|uniref:M20/M25/M40 family metallo-hydrolase n=1 Tax=Heliorestis acidaminivorans TaxID=553427 RepID=A0A6I0EQP6_9FIRM|nr:M20/M25/M40 family metallo-hydrolase [Heliorestis acidaminivorans]KAB2951696.1 M20/M25/M40 family metallo-hydrolase [Heliorestis acidaminivorans]
MIQQDRLVQEFLQLCAISSPGGGERQVADVLLDKLTNMGLKAVEDKAAEKIGGNAGNIYACMAGTGPGPAIFFSAHMDTVVPCDHVEPIVSNGVISSAGPSILGADDKAGIVAILEALRVLKETGEPHPTIEVIFTVQEEGGLKGAKVFDTSVLQSKMGYVLDAGGFVGNIIVRGPAQNNIEAHIYGRAAHAGICPEEGISAIRIASKAIQSMELGRIDEETTANIGTINGGMATNIIPENVLISGEARSLSLKKLAIQTEKMVNAFVQAAQDCGGKAEVTSTLIYPHIDLKSDETVVQLAIQGAEKLGKKASLDGTGGGSDANIFNGAGIPTVNLGIGMQKVHTTDEFITLEDLQLNAYNVLEIIRAAGRI